MVNAKIRNREFYVAKRQKSPNECLFCLILSYFEKFIVLLITFHAQVRLSHDIVFGGQAWRHSSFGTSLDMVHVDEFRKQGDIFVGSPLRDDVHQMSAIEDLVIERAMSSQRCWLRSLSAISKV